MKALQTNLLLLLFVILTLPACVDSAKQTETKILEQIKQQIGDFNFKRNLKIEILDSRIISLKEANGDSIFTELLLNKSIAIGFRLSGYKSWDEYFANGFNKNNLDEAENTEEYKDYKYKILQYKGQRIYVVKVYLKAIRMNLEGENKEALLFDNEVFFLEKNHYKIIDYTSEGNYNAMMNHKQN